MTEPVFYQDAYLRQLTATVTGIDGDRVELDRTIFYPSGGGQPGDTGKFTSPGGEVWGVVDTRKGDRPGSVVHQLETSEHGLALGDEVDTEIDWNRRYRLMKMHTSMHLLSAVVPMPVTGGAVGDAKSRLDFDMGDHRVDKESVTQALNRLVQEGHPVTIESITDAELDANPELVKTMSVQPPRGAGTIRMVRIEGVDYQPCGGTHLRNTREIGNLRVSKIENKGKRNRRFHLVLD